MKLLKKIVNAFKPHNTQKSANVVYFKNIKYTTDELQSVVINFAMGHLPLGYFKYTEGSGYTSIVPNHPSEGAEIITMPNDEVFATYRNGVWEIQMDVDAGHVCANSKHVPYIAGTRTVTCVA